MYLGLHLDHEYIRLMVILMMIIIMITMIMMLPVILMMMLIMGIFMTIVVLTNIHYDDYEEIDNDNFDFYDVHDG